MMELGVWDSTQELQRLSPRLHSFSLRSQVPSSSPFSPVAVFSNKSPLMVRELQCQMESAGTHWGKAATGWGTQTGLSWGTRGFGGCGRAQSRLQPHIPLSQRNWGCSTVSRTWSSSCWWRTEQPRGAWKELEQRESGQGMSSRILLPSELEHPRAAGPEMHLEGAGKPWTDHSIPQSLPSS